MNLYGYKVYVTHDTPKLQLAPGDYVSPEYRKEIDAWLIELLGFTNLLPDGQVITSEVMHSFHMNPRTYDQLKKAVAT